MKQDNNVMVSLPFIGEIGHLCFSWGPVVNRALKENNIEKCIVYGANGMSKMFPFADDYRVVELPKGIAETITFRDPSPEIQSQTTEMINNIQSEVIEEFGNCLIFWIPSMLEMNHSPLYLNEGLPYQLGDRDLKSSTLKMDEPFTNTEYDKGDIVFCIRDRELSSYRNYPFHRWKEIFEACGDMDRNCTIVGKINNETEWKDVCKDLPKNIEDRTNQTSIDDCIDIFSKAGLAVGGSSGTLHIASRCGCNHLVWGKESLRDRYEILNNFNADMSFIGENGWFPPVTTVVDEINMMIDKGEV